MCIKTFAIVTWLVYFSELQGYVLGSLMLPVASQLVKRFEDRGQTKSDPNDPHERLKKKVPCLDEGYPPLEPGLGVMFTDKHLVTGPPT